MGAPANQIERLTLLGSADDRKIDAGTCTDVQRLSLHSRLRGEYRRGGGRLRGPVGVDVGGNDVNVGDGGKRVGVREAERVRALRMAVR